MKKILIIVIVILGMAYKVEAQPFNATKGDTVLQTNYATNDICANIPNYFTPNRDGIDDEWCIKSSGADKCILWLWNRWGSHIIWDKEYAIEDNRTVCLWDNGIGNGGTTYPNGTYYYILLFKNTTNGTERRFEGIVELWGSTGKTYTEKTEQNIKPKHK